MEEFADIARALAVEPDVILADESVSMLDVSIRLGSLNLMAELLDIEGEIPDLTDLGSGCPFAPRCKHVMDVCHQAMPEPTRLEEDRWVRCYLYEDEASRRTAAPPVD